MVVSPIIMHPQIQSSFVEACKEIPLSDYPIYWDNMSPNVSLTDTPSTDRYSHEYFLLNCYLISSLAHSHQILLGASFASNEGDKGFLSTMTVFRKISNMCQMINRYHYHSDILVARHHAEYIDDTYVDCLCNLLRLTQRFCGIINNMFHEHKINPGSVKAGTRTRHLETTVTVMKEFQESLHGIIKSNKFLLRFSSNKISLLLHVIQYELYARCEVPNAILEILYEDIHVSTNHKVAMIPIQALLDVSQIINSKVAESGDEHLYHVLLTIFKNRNIWQDLDVFKLSEVRSEKFVCIVMVQYTEQCACVLHLFLL